MPKVKTRESQSTQDLRKLSLADLNKRLDKKRLQLQEIRAQLAIGKLTTHHLIGQAKKDLARIETVKQEKIILEEIKDGR